MKAYLETAGLEETVETIKDDIRGFENIGLNVKRTGKTYKIMDDIVGLEIPADDAGRISVKSDMAVIKDSVRERLAHVSHEYLLLIDLGFDGTSDRDYEIQTCLLYTSKALKSKRKKCMIGTGAMSDPYLHLEKRLCLTRQSLELIDYYGFGPVSYTHLFLAALQTGETEHYPFRRGIDFYHHYKEDLALMEELGLKLFRTSINWARIYPNGDDETPNEEGIQFYTDLFTECHKRGMKVFATCLLYTSRCV